MILDVKLTTFQIFFRKTFCQFWVYYTFTTLHSKIGCREEEVAEEMVGFDVVSMGETGVEEEEKGRGGWGGRAGIRWTGKLLHRCSWSGGWNWVVVQCVQKRRRKFLIFSFFVLSTRRKKIWKVKFYDFLWLLCFYYYS